MGGLAEHAELMDRAVAAYFGLAIGDALGATVEFMTPREIETTHGVHREIRGGGWLKLKPGVVTDDTTMALALGDALIEAGGVDPHIIAKHFDAWMRAKPVDIGSTVRRGLLHFRKTGETSVPLNEYDAGNGACMRTLPVALATVGHSDGEVLAAIEAQAHVTHNNPLADAGTFCAVRMVQVALLGGSLADIRMGPVQQLIDRYGDYAFRRKRPAENPSGYIVDTMRTVFEGFFDTDSFEDCLVEVVNRGGDADTTGAIVGMIAGAYYGLDAIPERWLHKMDPFIINRCRQQALAMLALAKRI